MKELACKGFQASRWSVKTFVKTSRRAYHLLTTGQPVASDIGPLRPQGINTLLVQGVAPTKVADLAGHSLTIQQRIYKKYKLQDDHSVLRDDTLRQNKKTVPLSMDADHPFPWEIDPERGEAFPFNGDE